MSGETEPWPKGTKVKHYQYGNGKIVDHNTINDKFSRSRTRVVDLYIIKFESGKLAQIIINDPNLSLQKQEDETTNDQFALPTIRRSSFRRY